MSTLLKQHRLKMTTLRHYLLGVLQQSSGHLSPEDLYREIKSTCPSASLSAIYRNLDEFVRAGIIGVIETDDRQRHYFACASHCGTQHHHHFVCIECKAVTPVFQCVSEAMADHVSSELHGKVLSHFFQINGLCQPCISQDETR